MQSVSVFRNRIIRKKWEELCENSETKVLPIYHVKEVIKHVFGEGEEKDGGVI